MNERRTDDTYTFVLETLAKALDRLNQAHTVLIHQPAPDAAVVHVAIADLGTVLAHWRGESGVYVDDAARSLRTIANRLMPINHDKVRAAYHDLREAEGIIEDNTRPGLPVSR
jgi:hypothetical protein